MSVCQQRAFVLDVQQDGSPLCVSSCLYASLTALGQCVCASVFAHVREQVCTCVPRFLTTIICAVRCGRQSGRRSEVISGAQQNIHGPAHAQSKGILQGDWRLQL
jgi:hypothetical protein